MKAEANRGILGRSPLWKEISSSHSEDLLA
jgi:hypothetical protein